jgi:hypothetical protein
VAPESPRQACRRRRCSGRSTTTSCRSSVGCGARKTWPSPEARTGTDRSAPASSPPVVRRGGGAGIGELPDPLPELLAADVRRGNVSGTSSGSSPMPAMRGRPTVDGRGPQRSGRRWSHAQPAPRPVRRHPADPRTLEKRTRRRRALCRLARLRRCAPASARLRAGTGRARHRAVTTSPLIHCGETTGSTVPASSAASSLRPEIPSFR